ncbi:5-dehydro-4-deoxyglucarate dehydratase [Alkalicoccobacillus porphyridii]|uniref:Probable 5-dehydro-4-deoxyglucarate dehydratase n=1 Tax=Alkalicoccobacillus porphyridii TaxID=2597270 RepID=A0A553ZUV6_9BACI|nr:5-dehydro-4-deoxyglucarate dehydratase [Alkalicoccobacillus porphyridii]TSB45278.1 5-dehydro-4-deoxyglucarate dehydratase [Alkalicoccobacillus porphyridii]
MSQTRKAPKGILGFPVAPLASSGKIDESALHRNITYLIEEGLEAIFIACGSGEFQSLSNEEYGTMIDVAKDATQKRVPIYSGVGGNLSTAISQAKISEEKGMDGYLILPPYLIEGEQEGLVSYIERILEASNLNAIVYQRDNAVLQLKALESLLRYEQLVGLKDGVGHIESNIILTQAIGDRLSWLNGMPMAEVTMPAYVPLGFDSYSSAISNYIPHISRRFYDALLAGRTEEVSSIYRDVILPINDIRKQRKGYAVSLIKAGMEIVGLPVSGRVRAPIVEVSKEHYKQLEAILEKAHQKYPHSKLSV